MEEQIQEDEKVEVVKPKELNDSFLMPSFSVDDIIDRSLLPTL